MLLASRHSATASTGAQSKLLFVVTEDWYFCSHRLHLARAAKADGYDVLVAADPAQGIEIAKTAGRPIELLVTDVVMPQMNGKALYETLVSSVVPDLRVIYISGYTDEVISHHGVLHRGINFLQKPISLQALTSKVRKVLDRN